MDIKAFNRWSIEGIQVQDPGLVDYINLKPRLVPKTGGKNVGVRFHKSKYFIVERLINKVMNPGHKGKRHIISSGQKTGKGIKAYDIVEKALALIEGKTKQNPIMVFVKAIENAAPREEILTIEYGGARYPKAVECAPQRRVDIVLKLMTQGAFQKCFNKKKSIESALADEIIAAYQMSQNSVAISKKLETERQADSSR